MVQNLFTIYQGAIQIQGKLFRKRLFECQEELAIEVEVGNILMVGEILASDKRDASVHLLFEGKIIAGIPILQADQTSAIELVWVSISEITKLNMYPNVSLELQDMLFLQKPGKYIGAIDQRWV